MIDRSESTNGQAVARLFCILEVYTEVKQL